MPAQADTMNNLSPEVMSNHFSSRYVQMALRWPFVAEASHRCVPENSDSGDQGVGTGAALLSIISPATQNAVRSLTRWAMCTLVRYKWV